MILFFEPPTSHGISGGYLYNARVSAASRLEIERRRVPPDGLEAALRSSRDEVEAIIVDSLYLDERRCIDALDRFRGVVRIGMIHYLPSRAPGITSSAKAVLREREERAGRVLDARVVTSGFVASALSREDSGPVIVVRPGVTEAVAATRRRRTWPPHRLLTVAAVTPGKGQRIALEALRDLRGRRWHWTIAGSVDEAPGYVDAFRRRLERRGLRDRVELAGRVMPEELPPYFERADLFLFPSVHEAYGIACAEAVASGLPVVAFRTGGVPEIVSPGCTGLLCRNGDRADLAAALGAMLTHPGTFEPLARGAYLGSNAYRGWDRCAAEFDDAIEALITDARSRRTDTR